MRGRITKTPPVLTLVNTQQSFVLSGTDKNPDISTGSNVFSLFPQLKTHNNNITSQSLNGQSVVGSSATETRYLQGVAAEISACG